MTLHFISNIKAESIKIRRTNAFWLTLGGAGFIPFVNFIRLMGRPDIFVPRMKDNPWTVHINDNWAPAASFLLPLYLILVISLIAQIEYGNNTWKQVYTTPRTYTDIFLSKFLIINVLIIGCFALFLVFIVLSGYAAFAINPDYPFTSAPVPWSHLISVSAKMYVSILGIVALQYGLSMRIKNFITPLGFGMALLIGGFMIRQWEYIAYYPYMHPVLVYFANPGLESGTADEAMRNSLVVCVMGLAAGFYSMCVRREKG